MNNLHLELLQLAQDKNSDANPSYLLNQGANPNVRDPFHHKWTPLHYAVFHNRENFALQLLSHSKTNAQLIDSDGFSPLYWAAKKSTPAVIKALLAKGCDPNQRDMHGMTALFAAVASHKPDNVRALLTHAQATINVNQPNQFGGSALHHTAFATDSVEIAELLVNAGANLFLYDYENLAPLNVAKRRKRKQLFAYFKRQMKECAPTMKCDVEFDDDNEQYEAECSTESIHNSTASEQSMGDVEEAPRTTQLKIASHSDETAALPTSQNRDALLQPPRASATKPRSLTPPMSSTTNEVSSSLLSAVAVPRKLQLETTHNASHQPQHDLVQQRSAPAQAPRPSSQHQNHTKDTRAATAAAAAEEMESRWHSEHRRRIQRVQESKLAMTHKIEQARFNQEARTLLQEQQHFFRYEKEVFYESMKHEYEKLHYQLRHVMNVNKQICEHNAQLKHENMKLQMALKYSNNGHVVASTASNLVVSSKNSLSAKNKEFKKWFRTEIGEDFMSYYQRFVDSGFDDLRTMRHIHHEQELVDLGITKKGHRLHILDKIEEYRMHAHQQHEVALPASYAPPSSHGGLNELQGSVDCEEGSFKTQ